MELQTIVNVLLMHLTETTIERDQARAEIAKTRTELTTMQERLAEIEAQVANPDPVEG